MSAASAYGRQRQFRRMIEVARLDHCLRAFEVEAPSRTYQLGLHNPDSARALHDAPAAYTAEP